MCDIFPDVDNCCLVITLRIGMLLISVLAIMTGVVGLSTVEQKSHMNYQKAKDATNISKPEEAMDKLGVLVSTGISVMSYLFMITGVCLLFGTLIDEEGLVQIFVWVTFFNVILGFVMVLGTAIECIAKSSCILSELDWLSGSALLVLIIGYLFLWIYFICVANSYVLGVVG
ncbi:uncharacterized protein LOC125072954 [Vanessa atalanta]|uniref:uncharacterized protein LOC125072954 n=1 Tax=Vanessa atalanta TaxID=42275 RepID=UPI001FCD60E5|nr:uncharacterized protein LOC125072954 [Vanessa atalanta]